MCSSEKRAQPVVRMHKIVLLNLEKTLVVLYKLPNESSLHFRTIKKSQLCGRHITKLGDLQGLFEGASHLWILHS